MIMICATQLTIGLIRQNVSLGSATGEPSQSKQIATGTSSTSAVPETNSAQSQVNSNRMIAGGNDLRQISPLSDPPSFTQHIMCKDHDLFYNPIDPTTTFSPGDKQAECLITVSVSSTIEYRWYYRDNSSNTWISCWNWSAAADGGYYYAGYLLIDGYWPGVNYPKAYKVDIYLDGVYSFSDFFEVTNGGLESPRMCEIINADGSMVNVKSRFTVGIDTEAYHALKFDNMAYFNEETNYCHNFTTVWIQPDGTPYKIHSSSFDDYKNNKTSLDCWRYGLVSDDFIIINSTTPIGNWRVDVYADSYFNGTQIPYGPIATTPFIVGNQTVAKWTFMVYLDGDNSLVNQSIDVFLKLAAVNSSSDVNVIVQMDKSLDQNVTYGNWTTCKRFVIQKGMTPTAQNAVQDVGEVDIGDPGTLHDFLNWSISNYPADRFFLVLWDHGAGCMGLCFDEAFGNDNLTLPRLTQAFTGLPVIMDDVLIDGCSMSMAEVAYQIKDFANVLIGPESLGWSPAPYDAYLTSLVSNTSISSQDIAQDVVFDYIRWSYPVMDIPNATMFATDLNSQVQLTTAVEDFAAVLRQDENLFHDQIALARSLALGYTGPFEVSGQAQFGYYIDLESFAQLINANIPDQKLRNASAELTNAIDSAMIAGENKNDAESKGLAIFYPDGLAKYDEFSDQYEKIAFGVDTGWDSFLKYDLSEWHMLTVKVNYAQIAVNVDGDNYTANDGKIQVFLQTGSHNVSVPWTYVTASDSHEVFLQWNDSSTSNPRTLVLTRDFNVEADFNAEYRLIVSTDFGVTSPPIGAHWFENGSHVDIYSISPDVVSGENYNWSGWIEKGFSNLTLSDNSTYITIEGALNITADLRHMYYLNVTSEHGSPAPGGGWFDAGAPIDESVSSPESGTEGTQYLCTGWTGTGSVPASGNASAIAFNLDNPSEIKWSWKTQYRLDVNTDPNGLTPLPTVSPQILWCDAQTNVTFTAQQVNGYAFQYWSAGSTTWGAGVNPITFAIDQPYTVTAHYTRAQAWWEIIARPDVLQAALALVGTFLTVGLLGGAWLRSRKHRSTLKNILAEIDDVYLKFKTQRQTCEEELLKLRNALLERFTEGKISEGNYEIIEKRIDKYVKELSEAEDKKKQAGDRHQQTL